MRPLALPLAALLAAFSPDSARACSVCSCGDPLADAAEQAPSANSVRVALETEWLTVRSASEAVEGAETTLDQYSLRAVGVWSPIDALNVALTVPLVMKRMSDEGGGLGHLHGPEHTGLGDVEVGARWFALNRVDMRARTRQTLALSAGTSLPTGANDLSQAGERIDEHAQLGTGGFGPYAGLAWRLQGDAWGAQASIAGRYRTANSHQYRYGESLLWSTGADWRPVERFAVTLGLDGRIAQRDRDDGAFAPDTGGLVLAAAPGVHVDVGRGVWLSMRAQLPVYTHLYGDQHVGPTVVAGAQVQLY
jgi:hypothetical protein